MHGWAVVGHYRQGGERGAGMLAAHQQTAQRVFGLSTQTGLLTSRTDDEVTGMCATF